MYTPIFTPLCTSPITLTREREKGVSQRRMKGKIFRILRDRNKSPPQVRTLYPTFPFFFASEDF